MQDYLKTIYDKASEDDRRAHYDAWAESYDADLVGNEYVTPERCARALRAAGLPGDAQVLDMGCGTGLSGRALHDEGFTEITGADVSDGMLAEAARLGIYRTLINTRNQDLPRETYDAVFAAGVVGAGAAGPELFDDCLTRLEPGGLFCFSFNDRTLEMPEYTGALDAALGDGRAQVVSREMGDHIRRLGSRSMVYVLRRQ